MNRRLLHRLRVRLQHSALRRTDDVWLDLDAELVRISYGGRPSILARPPGVRDPFGEATRWSRLVRGFRSFVKAILVRVTRSATPLGCDSPRR